jgi:hypothetical protein
MRLTPTILGRLRTGTCCLIRLRTTTKITPNWQTRMNTSSGWIALRCIRQRISLWPNSFRRQHGSSWPSRLPNGRRRLTTTPRLLTDPREPVFPSEPLPPSPPDLI